MSKHNGSNVLGDPLTGTEWHLDSAERAIIGGAIYLPDLVDEVSGWLKPDDFYRPTYAILWRAILNLRGQGLGVDGVSVYMEAKRQGFGDKEILPEDLIKVVEDTSWAARLLPQHATQVKTLSAKRSLRVACVESAVDVASAGKDDLPGVLDRLDAKILDIRAKTAATSTSIPTLRETVNQAMLDLEARSRGEGPKRIRTGFPDLDAIVGLSKKRVCIIAGRPSMGKSVLAKDIAINAARDGHGVFVATLEDSANQWTMRGISGLSKIPLTALLSGQLSPDDQDEAFIAADTLHKLPLRVDESARLTPEAIRGNVRLAQREGPIDLVVVDYLQLMVPPMGKRYHSRENEVSTISQSLVAMAKELDVAIVMVCQINRESVKGGTAKDPVMSDLRESGSLEQDGYQILLIHRPGFYEEGGDETAAKIIVAKNKDGRRGVVQMRFNGACMRFESQEDIPW
jgi:replicative DNA helicase